jgi:hypothetical protein
MSYRRLALSPVVFVALTAIVAALAPAQVRPTVIQGEVDLSKALGLVGMASAALAFDRGDYLRRGWGLCAACYVMLLGRDAVLLGAASLTPLAFQVARGVLVTTGNACVVAGVWTLARAWSVAGLEHPGSRSARRAVVGLAVLAAAVFAGPTLFVDVRDLVHGADVRLDAIGSDLGDILALPVIAPVALTAFAVREGTLRWPWTLLTSSLTAWLLYDAIWTVPDYFHVASVALREVAEQLHVMAGAFACVAGLAQRKAVTEEEEEG